MKEWVERGTHTHIRSDHKVNEYFIFCNFQSSNPYIFLHTSCSRNQSEVGFSGKQSLKQWNMQHIVGSSSLELAPAKGREGKGWKQGSAERCWAVKQTQWHPWRTHRKLRSQTGPQWPGIYIQKLSLSVDKVTPYSWCNPWSCYQLMAVCWQHCEWPWRRNWISHFSFITNFTSNRLSQYIFFWSS